MPRKGKISREEGFLRGTLFQSVRGSESFWGKCLKQFQFSENTYFPIFDMRNEMLHGKVCIGESLYRG